MDEQRVILGVARSRAIVRERKDVLCTDCGLPWPYYVMEHDHVPERGEKLFAMSWNTKDRERGLRRSQGVTAEELEAELAKCDPVCGNCHAIRGHVRQFGSR
jgi:hypothetical protein